IACRDSGTVWQNLIRPMSLFRQIIRESDVRLGGRQKLETCTPGPVRLNHGEPRPCRQRRRRGPAAITLGIGNSRGNTEEKYEAAINLNRAFHSIPLARG